MSADKQYVVRTAQPVKGYPGIERQQISGNAAAALAFSQIDEWLRKRFGSKGPITERAVTWGDLVEKGFARLTDANGNPIAPGVPLPGTPGPDPIIVPEPQDPAEDTRVPPPPSGLVAYAAMASVILEWDQPTFDYFGRAEIWRADTNNLAAAVNIGQTESFIYADTIGQTEVTYFYWVRFISAAGRPGPFNAAQGVEATTGKVEEGNIAAQAITADKLAANSITVANAALANAVVTTAKIDDLAVTDAKIASLAVGKLTAGAIAAGQYIRSANYAPGSVGFNIDASGQAEFYNIVARGDIQASSVVANIAMSAPTINGGTINSGVLNGGLLRGSQVPTNVIDLNAAAGGIFLRAGAFTYYGPYAGSHYPLELRNDGSAFLARGAVSGGQLLASGTAGWSNTDAPQITLNTDPGTDPGNSGP